MKEGVAAADHKSQRHENDDQRIIDGPCNEFTDHLACPLLGKMPGKPS
jgi:hypothetical protein